MSDRSPAGKGGRYRDVNHDAYDRKHIMIFGPSKYDLNMIFDDATNRRLAEAFRDCGLKKFVKNAEERHIIPLMQQMKYEIDAMGHGCKCRDWMREGCLKGDVADGDIGDLQMHLIDLIHYEDGK